MTVHVRPGRRDDRGSAELVIATPLLLTLVLLVVQCATWMHGDNLAAAIAQRSIAHARTVAAVDAQAHAQGVADDLGGALVDRSVTVQVTETTATVVVEAQVPSLLPGLTWPVRHELSAPVERFVPPTAPTEGGG